MKTKTLFNHIQEITNNQRPNYWDELDDASKKSWSNYMVHRFLSMKPEWIEVVNEIQQYWELKPKSVYQFYTDVIPKGRTFLKYTKPKKKSKIERLKTLLMRNSENSVEGEPVTDSFSDVSNYGVMAQVVARGKWAK